MNFGRFVLMENANDKNRQEMLRFGIAVLFIVGIIIFITMRGGEINYSLVVAAIISGYMALNIGVLPYCRCLAGHRARFCAPGCDVLLYDSWHDAAVIQTG